MRGRPPPDHCHQDSIDDDFRQFAPLNGFSLSSTRCEVAAIVAAPANKGALQTATDSQAAYGKSKRFILDKIQRSSVGNQVAMKNCIVGENYKILQKSTRTRKGSKHTRVAISGKSITMSWNK